MSTRQGYRLWPLLVALLSILGAAWLALHHPLSPLLALLACGLLVGAAARWPNHWPLWVLPLLPVAGLYTWTGSLMAEEFDLVVLATSAGLAWHAAVNKTDTRPPVQWLGWLALVLYLACLAVSTARGWQAATATAPGWWQGYHEPWNALRVSKGAFWAVLLLPPSLRALHADTKGFSARLVHGMAGLLAVVALLALWERWAYTGILNFSTDYRTTALFWEMHVGGAALDSALALSAAFAAAAVASARGTRAWVGWLAVAGLGAYACVTTFSRIVYLAVPLTLALWWLWRSKDVERQQDNSGLVAQGAMTSGAALALAFLAGGFWLFRGAGYRGLLALWMACCALPAAQASAARLSWRQLALACTGGAALMGVALSSMLVPKGPYVAHAAAAALFAGCAWARTRKPGAGLADTLAVAAWLMLAAGVATVSIHWGGAKAQVPSVALAGLLAGLPLLMRAAKRPLFSTGARAQGAGAAFMALFVLLIGVGGGGSYMGGRFDSSRHDLEDRLEHWRISLGALNSAADWAFGLGTGRYPALYMSAARIEDLPGDYRWLSDAQGSRVLLTGGRHVMGWGEVLRLSQRVDVPQAPAKVSLRVRAPQAVTVHVEVCEKHLLYNGRCVIGKARMEKGSTDWQVFQVALEGDWPLSRGAALAPRLQVFSLALGSPGTRAEVERVELVDASGRQLLQNTNFHAGLAGWYMSSDRNHMPWHAKNLGVHLLTEQGALGLLLWLGLAAAALVRLTRPPLSDTGFGAAAAAGIVGLVVVGVADSLLDIPRVSFPIHLLLGLGVTALASTITTRRSGRRRQAATGNA